ncbi:unnamed protein product [Mucor hiemalis]
MMTRRLCIGDEEEYNDEDDDDKEEESDLVNNIDTEPTTRFTKAQFFIHTEHYLQFLCNYREPEQLPLLEDINLCTRHPRGADKDFRVLCFATFYVFRKSLKSMNMIYTNSLNEGGQFVKSLLEFKSLTRLHIINDSDPNLTLFHLLQGCPNLSVLIYESTLPVSENEAQQLKGMLQKLEDQNLSTPHFLKNLKMMELRFPKPMAPYADFFTNLCPHNLENIVLNLTETSNRSLKCEREAALILDLCKSLQKFNAVQLRMCKRTRLINDNQIDSFYLILNALTGEKEFRKRAAVYSFSGDIDADISVQGSELSYSCHINHHFLELHDLPVPSDIKQLADLDHFTVDIGYHARYDDSLKNYLKYLQKYCPQLTQFQINGGCTWFKAECLDPSNPSLEYMTSVKIYVSDLSEELIDLLISYFPKIEVLNLTMYRSSIASKILFALSKFKSLRILVINVLCSSKSEEGPFFLKYTDSRGSMQYSLDRWNSSDKIAIRVEVIADDSIHEQKSNDYDRSYAEICVKTLHPLDKIEVKINELAWATLDL